MTKSQKSSLQKWQKWSEAKWKSLSCVRLFVTPWTLQSMEGSRPEYWSGLAFPFSRGSSQPKDQIQVSHVVGGFFRSWATREANDRDIA